ncbi:uncharacterized protein LOC116121651 [Pistacia vera]|uniref:uncharacterized protein LOC116121651 n=1 Tax=Pistacia vera TaxID=55513 RepID=UPI0012637A58|nr:uncharacterized protein LOC116121651 [Pistacia vera]
MGSEGISYVPIWVKFSGVPLEFWTTKGLSYVASAIGKPLYMDNITDVGDRLEYARVCVEIYTSTSFPNSVELGLPNSDCVNIGVEYSWKPRVCPSCRTFRHNLKESHLAPRIKKESAENKNLTLTQEWRMVTKRKENVSKDMVVQGEKVGESSSRKKELDNGEVGVEEGNENVEGRFGKDKGEMSGVDVPTGLILIEFIIEVRVMIGVSVLRGMNVGGEITPPRGPLMENHEGCEMGSTSPAIVRFGNLIRVDEKDGLKEGNRSLSKSQKRKLARKAREAPNAKPSHD